MVTANLLGYNNFLQKWWLQEIWLVTQIDLNKNCPNQDSKPLPSHYKSLANLAWLVILNPVTQWFPGTTSRVWFIWSGVQACALVICLLSKEPQVQCENKWAKNDCQIPFYLKNTYIYFLINTTSKILVAVLALNSESWISRNVL